MQQTHPTLSSAMIEKHHLHHVSGVKQSLPPSVRLIPNVPERHRCLSPPSFRTFQKTNRGGFWKSFNLPKHSHLDLFLGGKNGSVKVKCSKYSEIFGCFPCTLVCYILPNDWPYDRSAVVGGIKSTCKSSHNKDGCTSWIAFRLLLPL